MYKRVIYYVIITLLLSVIFIGCGNLSSKNDKNKEDVQIGIETVTEITPSEAKVDEETWIGVDVATLNYASEDRIVFHGNFGLFIYDLNREKIIRGIDVKSIGCGSTQ